MISQYIFISPWCPWYQFVNQIPEVMKALDMQRRYTMHQQRRTLILISWNDCYRVISISVVKLLPVGPPHLIFFIMDFFLIPDVCSEDYPPHYQFWQVLKQS